MTKYLAIVSGGMDSVTLAYYLASRDELGMVVSFDYGQRHSKELAYAEHAANALDVPWRLADLTGVLVGKSALTSSDVAVPDGHYAEESMKATVVPNRNAIMLSVACGMAWDTENEGVGIAVHGGDHFIYPDCRPEFIEAMDKAMRYASAGFANVRLLAPFLNRTKADIAEIGQRVKVPWDQTWSCYKGGDIHCGACGTCYERREAFKVAGITDPTEYASLPEYATPEA